LATHIGLQIGENAMVVITATALTLEIIVPNLDGMGGRTPIYLIKFLERLNEY